jgi:drug/metabolite transporter (DMT)-like permease
MPGPRTRALIEVLLAVLFWGASFVATKEALREVHPVTIIVLRFGLGVLVLALAVWRLRLFRAVSVRDLLALAALGAIGVALTPVFAALLAWVFLGEPLGLLKLLGLAIAFGGALVVVTRGVFTAETLHLPATLGDLLALASALNWAVFSVASKPLLRRLPPTLSMAYVMLLGWMFVLPFFVSGQGWSEVPHLSPAGWLAISFLGLFCSGLAYIFYYDALAQIDASQVAAFIYVEPLVTVVAAAIVLGEALTPVMLFGGLTILLGVYLVNRPVPRRAAHAPPVGAFPGAQ